MDGDTTERLSQESQCPKDGFHGLLARASAFAGGVLSSIQALAGTTACKGVQIWQIHAFREGNTRTTAIFTIQYLRSLGYEVNNEMFAKHSWYFRNALVRANYRNIQKGIDYSPIYLVRFFRNLLLKDGWVLKNRYLHIQPTDDWKEQPNLKNPHYKNILQKVDRKGGQKSEPVDRKGGQKTKVSIIQMIKDNPTISSTEMANQIGINRSAISKHLKKLKEDNIIKREGPAKGGKWIIITS